MVRPSFSSLSERSAEPVGDQGIFPATDQYLTGLTDQELVDRIKAGQEEAINELLRRYEKEAFRLAKKILRNESNARDAVQVTYLKVLNSFRNFEGRSSVKTWFLRIVRHAAIDIRRKLEREKSWMQNPETEVYARRGMSKQTVSILDELIGNESQVVIRRILKNLPERFSQVFTLRCQGHHYHEIANELGISQETARQEYGKAVNRIRRELHRLEGSVP